MKIKAKVIYRLFLAASILVFLFVPMLWNKGHEYSIQERPEAIPKPNQLWDGFFKREWQPYLEQRFTNRIRNIRAFLILSYNEVIHSVFHSRPNKHYIWTPELGYYPVDTILRLNDDVLHFDAIKQTYQYAARRLRILQEILSNNGVTTVVVIPPPKVRIYPEYASPYLVAPAESIMAKAVSYGDVLEENGVNVINVQRMFTESKKTYPWPFFAATGFHWNYWAGCLATDALMRKAETLSGRTFFSIGCTKVEYKRSMWADTDIASILNIFSTNEVIGNSPFPIITPQQESGGVNIKILIIGDSFSDHIDYALTKALPDVSWSPNWLTRYDSFRSRQTIEMGGRIASSTPLNKDAALSEILSKNLFVIEVSDGNVYRARGRLSNMEFGATESLLKGLLQRGEASNGFNPGYSLTGGWRTIGSNEWRSTGRVASFALRPSSNGKPHEIQLDVENVTPDINKQRVFDLLVNGKTVRQVKIPFAHRGKLRLILPSNIQQEDYLVNEISLRDTSGRALDLVVHGLGIDPALKPLPTLEIKYLALPTINLMGGSEPEHILVSGLSGIESNGKERWRWATGPATRIRFYVEPTLPDKKRQVALKFSFKNGVPIPEQTVSIRLNGNNIRRISSKEIVGQNLVDVDMVLSLKKGNNVLEFLYEDWNYGKKTYAAHDPRKLAVVVMRLSLDELPNVK